MAFTTLKVTQNEFLASHLRGTGNDITAAQAQATSGTLPAASFRFRLATDTLAFLANSSPYRACKGLAPSSKRALPGAQRKRPSPIREEGSRTLNTSCYRSGKNPFQSHQSFSTKQKLPPTG